MKIVFLGTPEFAVPTLERLIDSGFEVVGVVTAPDKPAGRGQQVKTSPVKQAAIKHSIPVLQPLNLRDPQFQQALMDLGATIQVVVAFRMLPEKVWAMPPEGSWNLHASLLPQYRGAAPINHAIINGEKEAGITTFKLSHEIDTGAIAPQQRIKIGPDETASDLHDRMMILGAELMVETLNRLKSGTLELSPQISDPETERKTAPKIYPAFCELDFALPVQQVHNKIRGLSAFPGAHTQLIHKEDRISLKVYLSSVSDRYFNQEKAGTVAIDKSGHIYVACKDGWLELLILQAAGKKRLGAPAFLAGFRFSENLFMESGSNQQV